MIPRMYGPWGLCDRPAFPYDEAVKVLLPIGGVALEVWITVPDPADDPEAPVRVEVEA